MGTKIFFYLFELVAFTAVLWIGFDQTGQKLPGLLEAPWIWAIVAIAPLIPMHWSCWDGGPSFFGDGCDAGDYGD